MQPLKKHTSLFLLLFCFKLAIAQAPFYKTITIDEDNASLKLQSFLKDHFGFIWAATNEGVYKLYGNNAVKFNLPGGVKKSVTALGEDNNGIIWVGCTDGTVARIKNNNATWFTPEEGNPKASITSFMADVENNMWFATAGEGIYRYDGKKLVNFSAEDGLTDNYVYALKNYYGSVVAATDRGLSFINYKKGVKQIAPFTSKNGLPDNIVRALAPSDVKGYWWLALQDKGVCLFDMAGKQIISNHLAANWQYGQVNAIKDLGNEVWIATEENGIIVYNKLNATFDKAVNGGAGVKGVVADMVQDNDGNLWIGNEGKLIKSTAAIARYYKYSDNNPIFRVHSLLADKQKRLWFTPDIQLTRTDLRNNPLNNSKVYPVTGKGNKNDITSLYYDDCGYLWIGTMGSGLIRFDPTTEKQYTVISNPLLIDGHILSIAGKDGDLWVASLNGVTRLHLTASHSNLNTPVTYKNYSKQDGIGADYVYNIFIDSKKRVWFATDGAGVAMLEGERFTNFYKNKILASAVIYSITEDSEGSIWLSTLNEGLYKYDGKKFTHFGIEEGLTDLAITSIAADAKGQLLVVNKKGLDLINVNTYAITHYGKETGFNGIQPNLNSISVDEFGRFWIGMENEIVQLNAPPQNQVLPKAVIETIKAGSTTIDTAMVHEFAYNENSLQVTFSSVHYTEPEKIKYQYFLEGYNKQWEQTSDDYINFVLLNAGTYTLKIRAAVGDNFNASPVARYRFTIKKAFWLTWYFRTAVLLLAGFGIYLLTRQRLKTVRRQEQLKNERFRFQYDALKNQVNPHFLFNSLNALLNVVEENPSAASGFIKQLSAFYRKITAYRDTDIITIKEELEILNTYLFIQQQRYGNALLKSIAVDVDLAATYYLPPLSLQLLAENAVKHNAVSLETPLEIKVYAEGQWLVVSNNLNAKFNKEESEGMGLQNIQNRFRLLTDAPLKFGTENGWFVVRLPMLKKV
ncbi:MAG: hypothetical protein EAZ16_03305 [Sphingobacteriales bacterium]|nr:MAG: hypothetical protein EAZ16_03305 [Sphingobacteriales bacterium]